MSFPIRFKYPPLKFVLPALLVLAGSAGLALWLLRQPQSNSIDRGWGIAQQAGCFSCHGASGRDGGNNPGSEELRVPSWDGGLLFMYVENTEEIGEWIEFGVPSRLRPDDHDHGSDGSPAEERHPGQHGLLPMPAFGAVLRSPEIDDLVALVRKIGNYGTLSPPQSAAAEKSVSERLGCFGCHRLEGLVGTPNPGSWKGYVPPWRGADFEELVGSEGELRTWILDGKIERLTSNPLAQFFVNRQQIQMPAYREHLSEGELDALVAYVQWVSEQPSLFKD